MNPRLSAILFTDIVGYTAMMQANQTTAMAMVKQYETALRELIAQHKGELLQTYGDGSLSVFDSASAAVRCAKELQEQVRDQVPLRIGIHLGEITIDGEHIFGDGVNIASRIESMGVAGAVLVSSNIRQQVKNKPEFEMESLGKVAFKNVAEPMTVYALSNEGMAIPKPKDMAGKGKKIVESKTVSQSWIRFASIGFVAMAVGAVIFWSLANRNPEAAELLGKDIREAKVGVSVFENFTGEESLDALGYMASEWISSGLREIKVRTVSPEMVRQHKDAIGILPNNPDNQASFAEITGAQYVVSGSYFLKGDSLVLNTRMSSAETGEEVVNFTDITEHKNRKEELIEEAVQYLLGYWAVKQDRQLIKMKPPTYKAYQVYLKCLGTDLNCYQEVLELDPSFLLARIVQMGSCVMTGNDSVFYRNKSMVEQNWDQTTQYERLFFNTNVSMYEGNYAAYKEIGEEIYRLDSSDHLTIHNSAFAALLFLNQPYQAVKRFEQIFDELHLYEDKINGWSYYHYIDALNRSGEYRKASDFYLNLSEKAKINAWPRSAYYASGALLYQNRIPETQELIRQRGGKKEEYIRAAFIYNLIHAHSPENPFANQLKDQIGQFDDKLALDFEGIRLFDWRTKASVYYILGEWDKAEEALKKMQKPKVFRRVKPYPSFPENAYWEKLWHTGMLGCVYARQGNRAQCEAQIEQLDVLGRLYEKTNAAFHKGIYPYLKARIYAEMGEKERAVELLQEAVRQGRLFGYMSFTMDMFLVNLKGYEPFEELIRPKG